jgi:acetoacetyl-CoA synthetase
MSDILWQPDANRIAKIAHGRFPSFVNQRHHLNLDDYPALHQWSIDQREEFWQAIVDFFDIRFHNPARCRAARRPINARRRVVSRRYRELRRASAASSRRRRGGGGVAENGQREQLTWAELAEHVAGFQASLQAAGVGLGDRVAACMPNTWQTLVAMLATTSLGAIWSCSSPDFGTHGVIDRFGQIEPKVLITCAGYRYAGKEIDQSDKLNEILEQLPTLQAVDHRALRSPARPRARLTGRRPTSRLWDDFYQPGGEPDFVPVPFNHPLYVLYSSGTTGVPKCIIHSTGGVLLQHVKEHGLHCDLGSWRSIVLLHDVRLDDVELAGLGARGRQRRGAV